MPVKLKIPLAADVGAPKPNKASKKNKKSWRKNVDMTEMNEFMEEKRFDERMGGAVADKPDEAIFTLDTDAVTETPENDRRRKRKEKRLKCFALLEGLPGAPDPVPLRNHTLSADQRENPIVKDMRLRKIKEGKINKKHLDRVKDRSKTLETKEAGKEEAKTRRRTKFDFDLWADNDGKESKEFPEKDWVNSETMVHSAIGNKKFYIFNFYLLLTFLVFKGKSQHVPKFAKTRNFSTGSKLAPVEVPDAGASYNPSLEEHQELLWKGEGLYY